MSENLEPEQLLDSSSHIGANTGRRGFEGRVGGGRIRGKAWPACSFKRKPRPCERPGLVGRSRVIRTLDPLLPKQVRYQAALYSVTPETCRRVLSPKAGECGSDAALYSFEAQRVQAKIVSQAVRLRESGKACTNRPRWGVAKW